MTIAYTSDASRLSAAISRALSERGFAEIVGLPAVAGCDPDLDQIIVMEAGGLLEAHIPSAVAYSGSQPLLVEACSGPELPGGARLLGVVDDGPAVMAADLVELLGPEPSPGVASTPPPLDPVRSERPPLVPGALTALDRLATVGEQPRATIDAETLAAELALTIKGQADALTVIADAIAPAISKAEPRRPASVLLVGATGIGKTAASEELARILLRQAPTDQRWALVRVDLNQAREAHSVSDLLGAPAGYVGHGDGSSLALALASSRRTIVIFDEVDKAHPDVLTVLMGAMDQGRLQLRRPIGGRWEVDCRQAVFVFTSNLGAGPIADHLAAAPDTSGAALEDLARRVLIAEGMPDWLAGRHGRIAVFRPLSTRAIAEIATLEIARLAEEFHLDLTWVEPPIVDAVIRDAQTSVTGARALRLAADRLLSSVLARARGTEGLAGGEPIVLADDPVRVVPLRSWEGEPASEVSG